LRYPVIFCVIYLPAAIIQIDICIINLDYLLGKLDNRSGKIDIPSRTMANAFRNINKASGKIDEKIIQPELIFGKVNECLIEMIIALVDMKYDLVLIDNTFHQKIVKYFKFIS